MWPTSAGEGALFAHIVKVDSTEGAVRRLGTGRARQKGLAPVIVDELVVLIAEVGASGIPIVLVEQSFTVCQLLASRHYILEEGRVVFEGNTDSLTADASILDRFLGLNVGAQ